MVYIDSIADEDQKKKMEKLQQKRNELRKQSTINVDLSAGKDKNTKLSKLRTKSIEDDSSLAQIEEEAPFEDSN